MFFSFLSKSLSSIQATAWIKKHEKAVNAFLERVDETVIAQPVEGMKAFVELVEQKAQAARECAERLATIDTQ